MNGSVVAIASAFFVIGITVGIIAVVAISVLRASHLSQPGHPGNPLEHEPGEEPPDAHWDDAAPRDRQSWPGEVGNDFSAG